MVGSHLRRAGSVAVAASVLALALFVPAVSAGNTRYVFVGSALDSSSCPAAIADPARVGTLTSTAFSRGGQFRVDVVAKNCGGSNLTNVQFTIGANPGALDLLAVPFSATGGFKVSELLSQAPSGLKCNSLPTTLLSCTLKALGPGEVISVSAVITSTTGGDASEVYAAMKTKENTNDGGTNQDTFEATTGLLTPAAFDCDTVQTFFSPKADTAGTCDVGTGNPQSGKIKYDAQSLPVTLAELVTSNTGLDACTNGAKTPVGKDLLGAINGDGSTDVVTWTIQVDLKAINRNDVKASDIYICHWDDNGHVSAPTSILTQSKNNKSVLTVTFTTAGNGKTRLLG